MQQDLTLNTITGSVAINSGSLANSNGALVNISGGTVSLDCKASLSQANNFPLVSITNHATGTISFSEKTLSATNGNGLQFSNADGTYIFSDQLTLNGGDAGIDILAGSGGTFTFEDTATITNPSGTAFMVQSSTPTITYSGSISDNSGYLLDVDNMDGGTLTFQTGNLTSTASGVRILNSNGTMVNFDNPTKSFSTSSNNAITLTNNASSTFSFKTGTLTINTTSGRGIDASNGGTIEFLDPTIPSLQQQGLHYVWMALYLVPADCLFHAFHQTVHIMGFISKIPGMLVDWLLAELVLQVQVEQFRIRQIPAYIWNPH